MNDSQKNIFSRPSGRLPSQIRDIQLIRNYTNHAEGSVLICCGNTKVLCNASIEAKVPPFLRGKNQGWVTAEYGMLPRSTHTRMAREATRGKASGRTQEIQRLIGRSLRACIDLKQLGEHTITVDCDVIQADGGTRTASITGAWLALHDAVTHLLTKGKIKQNPILGHIASISVGIVESTPLIDLDYPEDSNAETDMNIVMDEHGKFIEIQGTAEKNTFSYDELNAMLSLTKPAILQLIEQQKQALNA